MEVENICGFWPRSLITPVRNRRKYSGFKAGVDTPEAKIFRFVRKVPPEIFDRVALAFQRELKGS